MEICRENWASHVTESGTVQLAACVIVARLQKMHVLWSKSRHKLSGTGYQWPHYICFYRLT